MDVPEAYGLKNLKIRAAATRWLSHGHACRRLIDRYLQIVDALDIMIDKKHDPEVEGIRNMLLSKSNVSGILVLCDLLHPIIAFSDYLQSAAITFSNVNQRLKQCSHSKFKLGVFIAPHFEIRGYDFLRRHRNY